MNSWSETPKRRRWLAMALAGGLAIAALGTGIVLVSTTGSSPSASPTDGPVDAGDEDNVSEEPVKAVAPPKTGPLSEDADAESQRATAALDAIISATDEIAQRGDGSAVGIDTVATGWVLGELQSKAREQYDLGYKQVGEVKVTSVTATAVDLTTDPATITLKACVDVSDLDVLDSAGTSLKQSLYNPGHPVAHIYGAVFEGDTWKISTHDIPDVQDCPAA